MFEAIVYAHGEIKKICDFINQIVAEVGKKKEPYNAALLICLVMIPSFRG